MGQLGGGVLASPTDFLWRVLDYSGLHREHLHTDPRSLKVGAEG